MMKKLIIACTCILVIFGSSGTYTYANQTGRNANQLSIITPDRIESSTTNSKLVVEFIAPRDSNVTIYVYHNTSLEKGGENFVLIGEPINMEVGALERCWAEVDLRRGTNKIEVVAVFKDGTTAKDTRIVRVSRVEDVKRSFEDNKFSRSTTQILQGIGR